MGSGAYGQDIHFSHLNHSKLFINPGFAGSGKTDHLTISHRNLSPAGFGNYLTYKASYNQYFKKINSGIGLMLIRDTQGSGAIKRTYISGIYAYRIKLQNNLHISPALEFKYASASLNTKNLIFPEMFNPTTWDISKSKLPEGIQQSSGYLEFNTGAVLRYTNEYLRTYRDLTAGLAVHHINKPHVLMNAENRINPRVTAFFNIELYMNRLATYQRSTLLIPTFLYSWQTRSDYFQYGAYLKYKNFVLGGFIRHNSRLQFFTPIIQMGVIFSEFAINYSYDSGFLNYKRASVISGAHEVTLSINFSIRDQ